MTIAADPHRPHVLQFCEEVVVGATPVRVPCAPDARAQQMDCFETVDQRVRTEGGHRVLGWAIWEAPGILIESEFHAVWAHPVNGALFDIAQRPMTFSAITFIADPSRQYEGRQVDNVRKPLTKDPKVRQFIYLMKRRFEILNTGALADQHGEIELPPRLRKTHDAVMRQLVPLARRLFGP